MTTVSRRPQSRRQRPKGLDVGALADVFRRFRELKNAEALAKTEHEQLRDKELMPVLEQYGEAHGDQGQHLAIPLPEPIDGFTRLVRRANTSTFINIDRAEALAETRGFLPQVQTTSVSFSLPADVAATPAAMKALADLEEALGIEAAVSTTFDQDRLYAYHQAHRDKLSEKDMDSLLDSDTRYSFHPEK